MDFLSTSLSDINIHVDSPPESEESSFLLHLNHLIPWPHPPPGHYLGSLPMSEIINRNIPFSDPNFLSLQFFQQSTLTPLILCLYRCHYKCRISSALASLGGFFFVFLVVCFLNHPLILFTSFLSSVMSVAYRLLLFFKEQLF